MENLLVEVERICDHRLTKGALRAFRARALVSRERPADLLHLECRFVRLEDHIGERVGIVYPEIIVVRAREDVPAAGSGQP